MLKTTTKADLQNIWNGLEHRRSIPDIEMRHLRHIERNALEIDKSAMMFRANPGENEEKTELGFCIVSGTPIGFFQLHTNHKHMAQKGNLGGYYLWPTEIELGPTNYGKLY